MTSDETYRLMARRTINAARKGYLPKPSPTSGPDMIMSEPSSDRPSEKVTENSIEVYDDHFDRNSILTRSARMRKFKFYQYKPVKESSPMKDSTPRTPKDRWTSSNNDTEKSPSSPDTPVLALRDDILKGKVALVSDQSKELVELDDQIAELEKRIADLNSSGNNSANHLDVIFELVNQKNDLLRRQMQLNILEQEKSLEKANEELTKELRSLLSIDDSKKTPAQLERQQKLYDESLALVNKRNELVHHMDVQEKAIEDDNMLKETVRATVISHRDRLSNSSQDQTCCIQ